MSRPARRVVSLVPAGTEIVASLGMLDCLVGVSHECDHPDDVNEKPRVTRGEIHGGRAPERRGGRLTSASSVV